VYFFVYLSTFVDIAIFNNCGYFILYCVWFLVFFSPLGKLAEGLSILLALISSFFTMSKAISVSTGPIFTIFSLNGRYLRELS